MSKFTPFEPAVAGRLTAPDQDESGVQPQPDICHDPADDLGDFQDPPDNLLNIDSASSGPGAMSTLGASSSASSDGPGHLSNRGPRHNNDHQDINKIDIMPTREELFSVRPEYLPVNDPRTWHKQGLQGLVDRQFRLYREDTVGLIRDAVRRYLGQPAENSEHKTNEFKVYNNVHIDALLSFDPRGGVVFSVQFRQPLEALRYDEVERYEWWLSRKGFQHDSLVCILDARNDPLFAFVGHYGDTSLVKNQYGGDMVTIYLRPFDQDDRYIDLLLECSNDKISSKNWTLLEFPSFAPWVSVPHLRALQLMSLSANTRLAKFLEPSGLPQPVQVPPPRYATANGFRFDIGATMKGAPSIPLGPSSTFDPDYLQANSNLDGGQSRALLFALQHCVAPIQGPPGTGKSYTAVAIIRTLLQSLPSRGLGPIICVSYKNQTLDSLLEKLQDEGVESIIRVGGQSNSEVLAPLNLRERLRQASPSAEEQIAMQKALRGLHTIIEGFGEKLDQLPGSDYDRDSLTVSIKATVKSWWNAVKRFTQARELRPLNMLRTARVVGVTVSGLAHRRRLFERLEPKIVVVEEAGCMAEAHALAAITPSVQHCIFIGDHFQLRPRANRAMFDSAWNPAARQFGVDVSLLERLINSGLPCSTLDTQYRMHPLISSLCKQTLYPSLQDAAEVKHLPPITAMAERISWLDHDERDNLLSEGPARSAMSVVNEFEVEMTAGLVKHLLSQDGISPGDIAIVTPYAGQAARIQQRLRARYMVQAMFSRVQRDSAAEHSSVMSKVTASDCIRIATVDSFQGEEADIIVLSLVRSNPNSTMGFVKSPNRAVVALSRARRGMYIFGSVRTLRTAPFWDQVISVLNQTNSIGNALQIQCPRHSQNPRIRISRPEDFSMLCPRGGCTIKCGKFLPCGHDCPDFCHSESAHINTHCRQPCTRTLACGHLCTLDCGSKCSEVCQVLVGDRTPLLPCGHNAPSGLMCFRYERLDILHNQCEEAVTIALPCGHTLDRPCCDRARPVCTSACGRLLPCGHHCLAPCHNPDACPPCMAPCNWACQHQTCAQGCSDICIPCLSPDCAEHLEPGTRKFVREARRHYLCLASSAAREMQALDSNLSSAPQDVAERLATPGTSLVSDSKNAHVKAIRRLAGANGRYKAISRIVSRLHKDLHPAVTREGAIQQAWDALSAQQQQQSRDLTHPSPQLQELLLVLILGMRLELAVVSDFLALRSRAGAAATTATAASTLVLDFSDCRRRAARYFDVATARGLAALAVEADVLWAQWAVLERRAPVAAADAAAAERVRAEAKERLERAEGALDPVQGVGAFMDAEQGLGLQEEIEGADEALAGQGALGVTTGVLTAGFVAGVGALERRMKDGRWRMCASGHYYCFAAKTAEECAECGGEGVDAEGMEGVVETGGAAQEPDTLVPG